jgi:hypothetical protein
MLHLVGCLYYLFNRERIKINLTLPLERLVNVVLSRAIELHLEYANWTSLLRCNVIYNVDTNMREKIHFKVKLGPNPPLWRSSN